MNEIFKLIAIFFPITFFSFISFFGYLLSRKRKKKEEEVKKERKKNKKKIDECDGNNGRWCGFSVKEYNRCPVKASNVLLG